MKIVDSIQSSSSEDGKEDSISRKVNGWDFLGCHGIILIDYFQKEKTITGQYDAALLERLNNEIEKNSVLRTIMLQGINRKLRWKNCDSSLWNMPRIIQIYSNLKKWLTRM